MRFLKINALNFTQKQFLPVVQIVFFQIFIVSTVFSQNSDPKVTLKISNATLEQISKTWNLPQVTSFDTLIES